MHFTDILAAILKGGPLEARLPEVKDPKGLEFGEEIKTNWVLGGGIMIRINRLQGLIVLLKRQEKARLAKLPPMPRKKKFRSRKEYREKVAEIILRASGIRERSTCRIRIVTDLIEVIVLRHIPKERTSSGNSYFLDSRGRLFRGIGID